jgi:type 1 fimbriae regulatory protein FimB/type 1 fimbriae regulatory protein FimE
MAILYSYEGTGPVTPTSGKWLYMTATLPLGLREYPDSPYLFVSERGAPMEPRTFRHIVARAGGEAGIKFPVHPHMLRHACGYKLANDGHDTRAIQHYLGHQNIQHTARYTALRSDRFNEFWRD